MQKIILLSTLMLSTSVMAANTHKSITVDPSFTSKGAIELVENSDKVQIMGKKVNGKQTCWVEATKDGAVFKGRFKSIYVKNADTYKTIILWEIKPFIIKIIIIDQVYRNQ